MLQNTIVTIHIKHDEHMERENEREKGKRGVKWVFQTQIVSRCNINTE